MDKNGQVVESRRGSAADPLERHPELKERMEKRLAVVEQVSLIA